MKIKEISKTIQENTRLLITSLVIVASSITAIFISVNYFEEGSLVFLVFFWGGVIVAFINVMKLFHIFKVSRVDLFKISNQEVKKVHREVEKKKRKAEKMGLPKLISSLYHDNIKYYPSWIDNAREYVPIIVERAVKQKASYEEEKLEIILNNKVYLFKYEEDDEYDNATYLNLELYINGKKVFAITKTVFNLDIDIEPSVSVHAFVEGDWINDFLQLDEQIKILEKKREKDGFDKSAEISKLKKDFGL